MGLLTDFFICSSSDLQARCPGWVPRLKEPKVVRRKNPFTGEEVTVESRDPEIAISGATHVDLEGLERLQLKSFDNLVVDALIQALPLVEKVEVGDPALFGPEDVEEWVFEIPPKAVQALAALGAVQLDEVARAFVDAKRRDLETISDEFIRDSQLEFATVEVWGPAIGDIHEIAKKAQGRRLGLYLWMSL